MFEIAKSRGFGVFGVEIVKELKIGRCEFAELRSFFLHLFSENICLAVLGYVICLSFNHL